MAFLNFRQAILCCITAFLFVACDFSTSEEIAEKENHVSCGKAAVCPDMLEAGTICDVRDGKVYKTVKIGSQTWLAENVAYCTDNTWCYDDNASNCEVYGRLYEWSAAVEACPEGFHLPSRDEWDLLAAYALEQAGDENSSLRSVESWTSSLVTPGNDVFGFTALASGRYYFRAFTDMGYKAYYWTSESEGSETAYIRSLSGMFSTMGFGNSFKDNGLSVRCIED
ncbi:MAG: fibrobacter succinogenes major paralogous domain-containing protein [Fibrobacter sp.]|nr:fibrobacter succinogenes major paralogous domain-containing protein [Fibrobacter sp.]